MICEEHGRNDSVEIDRVTVRGKTFTRCVCGLCDDPDWWEDEDGNEVSSPYEDDEADTTEDT